MKKIFISIITVLGIFGASSCSDMLEVESTQQVTDPALGSKTDSLFYAYGVMQAMQQLADQYAFIGEMRGDLVNTTIKTDDNLRQLANFSATTANKYDSAYVYYRVINNCNYYITHRDTTLLTGATNVTTHEYVAMKAFRAWAYLQLVRCYGKVPYFTEPLMSISEIDNARLPEVGIKELAARLNDDLARHSGIGVPYNGATTNFPIGNTNHNGTKYINISKCYIPVDVILGEVNLEAGNYAAAAHYYSNYLITNKVLTSDLSMPFNAYLNNAVAPANGYIMAPTDYLHDRDVNSNIDRWSDTFGSRATSEIISYIPMAAKSIYGVTTDIPSAYGYNYYGTGDDYGGRYDINYPRMIVPSKEYNNVVGRQDFYYYKNVEGNIMRKKFVGETSIGDVRYYSASNVYRTDETDSTYFFITKSYANANIILYRTATIYLHLAEALNRLGYPDAAFAILKEGINDHIMQTTGVSVPKVDETGAPVYKLDDDGNPMLDTDGNPIQDTEFKQVPTFDYITDATRTLLTTTYPFLSEANRATFYRLDPDAAANYGIHSRGSGITYDGDFPGRSPYQMDTIVGLKLKQLAAEGVAVGKTKQDTINAMEDLICDEYALELAFEGRRFYDLCRLARHKNAAGTYGGNYGAEWLKKKLEYKNPVKDLSVESNWYLPFR